MSTVKNNKNENMRKKLGFGDRLRFLRQKAGLTQAELAQKLGYKRSGSLSNLEAENTPADIYVLTRLAHIFGANLHWLITGQPSPDGERWRESYIDLAGIARSFINRETARIREERAHLVKQLNELNARQIRGQGVSHKDLQDLQRQIDKLEVRALDNTATARQIIARIYGTDTETPPAEQK